ncbi:MAG: hypothetical protein AB1696_02850 [Planctomycetota bacterium]
MKETLFIAVVTFVVASIGALEAEGPKNLLKNGDFETVAEGKPEAWGPAGAAHVKQQLTSDIGREGKGASAKLSCTEFGNGTPASHAMICQVGTVGVKKGKWYRLTLWAKGEGIRGDMVHVGLSNTKSWSSAGLREGLDLKRKWQRFETVFQAVEDLPPENSRFQISFNSTGTLWLDDVELVETEIKTERHPQLTLEGLTNFIPNSSFECDTAGWGSYAPDLKTWTGNIYQLIGDLDDTTAVHGKHSLRIRLSPQNPPTYFFGYQTIRQQPRCVLAAHHGWAPMERKQSYTLSASLKSDQASAVGVLLVRQAGGRTFRKDFPLTTDWQRCVFTFTAEADSAWAAVGLDLDASKMDSATVWIDAVQLERGTQATPYQPRASVEVMVKTEAVGNVFVTADERPNIALQLHVFNDSDAPKDVNAEVSVTDFFDAEVLRQTVPLSAPAKSGVTKSVSLPIGKRGFYRVKTTLGDAAYLALRCAVIKPYGAQRDSRFAMNHAYPWAFLLHLSHQAGILWWRDWTVQWQTVQPEANAPFDFRETDPQIDRVSREGGKVLLMFPYPSSSWVSTSDPATIEKILTKEYQRARLPWAFKPKDEDAFTRYITETVRHYKDRIQVYQIFNESLYTNYALPARGGHTLDDYMRLLRIAYQAIKAEQPDAIVVGGLGIWADNKWTKDFVEAGGLQFADVLDLHLYPKGRPEVFGESLAKLWQRMKEKGEAKPIWVTELGCYGEDDPPITPFPPNFGDEAMRNALRRNEREAAEWLVKFATIFFANGGGKIFLHAGTCGEINGMDAGGVFFKYGGTPRKIYAAVSTMANLLPPEATFDRSGDLGENVTVYWFHTPAQQIGVAWSADGEPCKIELPANVQSLDIMGNPISGPTVTLTETPIYLVKQQ